MVAAITGLKESPGKDILQYGPSDLLFGSAPSVAFRLVGSTTLSHGIIILNYVTDNILP